MRGRLGGPQENGAQQGGGQQGGGQQGGGQQRGGSTGKGKDEGKGGGSGGRRAKTPPSSPAATSYDKQSPLGPNCKFAETRGVCKFWRPARECKELMKQFRANESVRKTIEGAEEKKQKGKGKGRKKDDGAAAMVNEVRGAPEPKAKAKGVPELAAGGAYGLSAL